MSINSSSPVSSRSLVQQLSEVAQKPAETEPRAPAEGEYLQYSQEAVATLRENISRAMASVEALRAHSGAEEVAAENRSSAESQIRDVDFASAFAERTALSILGNSNTALGAHGNQKEATILNLLKS